MGKKENTYSVLVWKTGGKRELRRHRHRQENNIKLDFKEIAWEGVDQCFSIGGTRTTGGTRRVLWWNAKVFENCHFFYNIILNVLITLFWVNCTVVGDRKNVKCVN